MKHQTTAFVLTITLSLFGLVFSTYNPVKADDEIVFESVGSNRNPQTAIKCGDKLRITHVATGAHLHSHRINYSHPGSSGQQQVTAFSGADFNDVWIVRSCPETVGDGDTIKLEHAATNRYLHSHRIPAPITKTQQEVTGYGGGATTDRNDLWRVEVIGGGAWTTDKQVRLIHVETNAALHSHNISSALLSGQQEVTGFSGRDNNDLWTANFATDLIPPPPPKYPWVKIFEGNIQHSDVWSRLTISNNGRLDYVISIKNRDRVIGSCVRFYIILSDNSGNILRTLGADQFCVDARIPVRSRAEREDRLSYTLTDAELSQLGNVEVVFSPGTKNFLEQLKGNLQQVNDVLRACPECVKIGAAVGG